MFQVPCLAEAIFSAEDFRLLVLIMRKSVKDAAHFTDEDAECYKYALSGPCELMLYMRIWTLK